MNVKMNIEISKGLMVHDAAEIAIKKAKECKTEVTFEFNELDITVYPQSYFVDICRIYILMREMRNKGIF